MTMRSSLLGSWRLCMPMLVLGAALAACSGKTPDESIGSAKGYLAKGDLNAAIIELKNALQAHPDLGEARLLLGKALLDHEEPAAAEVELRKASELKVADDEVLPQLAKALLRSGNPDKLIELDKVTVLTLPAALASFKTTVAQAHAAKGNAAKAEAAVAAALQAQADFAPALLFRARALAGKRDLDPAMKIVDAVLAKAPDDTDAITLKGDILFERHDAAGATALYRKVLAAKPADILANEALLTLMLGKNDIEGARTQFEALKKVRPGHPLTIYFQAVLAANKGELDLANDLVQQLLKWAPDDLRVLQLAGGVALQRNELLVAQSRLDRVVVRAPDARAPRQMLARAYLRGGDAAKTLDTLAPLLQSAAPDAQTLAMAAGANFLAGDFRTAQGLFARAAKLDPASTHSRAGAAVARVAGGDAEGLRELQAIASDDRGADIDMTLVSALMSRRDYDGALKAIDRLEKKAPGKPLAPHLRAQALALRGDLVGARASYEKALAADRNYYAAIDGLAALDWREKKPDAARARFAAVLKANPSDVRAMVGLANLEARAGKPKEEVAAILANAVSVKPTDTWLRRQLIQYHLARQDYKLALNAAQEAVTVLPKDPDMLALLAGSQLAAGDANQAISSYSKLASMRPRSPLPLLGLADAHIANKSYGPAAETVKRAMALAPDSPAVAERGVKVDVLTGHFDAALARARALQARSPKAAPGFVLEGDLHYSQRNWATATAAYRSARQLEPASESLAQRLYLALRAAAEVAKADALAAEWTKAHPEDPRFPFFLAGLAIADRKYELAEAQLRQVLRLDPDNAMAVNNLAWTLWAQKKPGALEAAERANQLAPNQPLLMDTLAMILAEQGQLSRALQLQQKAVELQPNGHVLHLALARLYLKSGQKKEARKELDELANLGDKFPQQAEVRELLGRL